MTTREMTEAMLAGETLESVDATATAYYDQNDFEHGPYVYQCGSNRQRLTTAWFTGNWHIKTKADAPPSPRDRMIGFCSNTPGIVVRFHKAGWVQPGSLDFSATPYLYEWTTVDIYGHYGEPHKFEVEE